MASESALSTSHGTDVSAPSGSTNNDTVICVLLEDWPFDPHSPLTLHSCGSSPGTSPAHMEAARSLAKTFHKYSIKLVYGGGTTGMMGEIARTLVSLSGSDSVHGIIPKTLQKKEQEGGSIDEQKFGRLTVVPNMHTRKDMMAKEVAKGGPGSGFIALTGGYGTLEELMEMTTWNQLGIHPLGVCVYNVEGYWNGILEWIKSAVNDGFIAPGSAGIVKEALSAEEAVQVLREYTVAEGRLNLDWSQN